MPAATPTPDPAGGPVVVSVPMRVRFRGVLHREAVLLSGPAGWGEFSPFTEYDDAESVAWWRAAREAAQVGWPAPVRDRVPVNATVPAVGPQQAAELVAAAGCRTVKVKVAEPGQGEADDLARLEAVRGALGSGGAVRVDANGAWDTDTAAARLPRYDRAAGGLQYAEQPCRTVGELAALRRRVSVPIAADESVRKAADPLRVAREGAADIVVLKVQPLGGVAACLRIADGCGLPVVVSSALETSVGIAAGVALAAALPQLPYACGLGTVTLFTGDVADDPLVPVDGYLPVRPVQPSPGRLAALAAGPEVTGRWNDRVARVRSLAAG